MISDELEENLVIILDKTDVATESETQSFLCEDEIVAQLKAGGGSTTSTSSSEEHPSYFEIQEPLAIVWNSEDGGKRNWYIGFYMGFAEEGADSYKIDHLERCERSESEWERPKFDDVQTVQAVQILPCDVEGEWDFSKPPCRFVF